MKKRASYITILFIALIGVVQSMAQSSQPDVVCKGTKKNYYVDATGGSSYIWKIDDGSPEASTTNSVDIMWTTSGVYTLTVQEKTKDNCLGQFQELQVTVIVIPNTLTPNDGKNNLFMPGYQMQIFNRNGIMLYDGMDKTEGWDGKYNNKTVSKDTYFYVIYNPESSNKPIVGYIMVIP